MEDKASQVVRKARLLLKKQIYDDAHDLAHHLRVWSTAKEINENENTKANKNLLKIACMWHDVLIKDYPSPPKNHKLITNETAIFLRELMLEKGFTHKESKRAYLAVKHHELNDIPLNIEGKILFDADKLDAFNPQRSAWFANSKQGRKSLWKIKIFALKNKLVRNYVKRKFHYGYSRLLLEKMIRELTR